MPPALPTMLLSFLKMCMAEEGLDCTKCKQIGSLRVAVPQKSNGRERLSFREQSGIQGELDLGLLFSSLNRQAVKVLILV